MRTPEDGLSKYLEVGAVLTLCDRQEFNQVVVVILVEGVRSHPGCVILDFLLIVDAALDTQVIFLVGFILLEILTNRSRDNLGGSEVNDILEHSTVEASGIQIAKVIYKGLGGDTVLTGDVFL